ncbi:MAG: glycosyltransferase [Rickettsiales bacterium]|nr:glycosyltransferase [Rickettsiales bacterium]MCA0254405.1 glycosyltransferase [Pseudomonadota bacterium]
MFRCSYIVLIRNNEASIAKLVDSLKKIRGDFRKEYIFVDDGSSDDSLSLLKKEVNDLPRTTIITQEPQGPSISVNKALSLASGDYVHFVEGSEELLPESTSLLMDACVKLGTEVAIGLVSKNPQQKYTPTRIQKIIENPIYDILSGKKGIVRNLGKSGTIINTKLLDKVEGADSSIYTQNMSLSLRCAKYTKFAILDDYVTINSTDKENTEIKFTTYNNLKAIHNFARENPEICSKYVSQMLSCLARESINFIDRAKLRAQFFLTKFIINTTSLEQVLKLYKAELDKLF